MSSRAVVSALFARLWLRCRATIRRSGCLHRVRRMRRGLRRFGRERHPRRPNPGLKVPRWNNSRPGQCSMVCPDRRLASPPGHCRIRSGNPPRAVEARVAGAGPTMTRGRCLGRWSGDLQKSAVHLVWSTGLSTSWQAKARHPRRAVLISAKWWRWWACAQHDAVCIPAPNGAVIIARRFTSVGLRQRAGRLSWS